MPARLLAPSLPPRPAAPARGFTLLEALVAVLVVAVGLLGMAKLESVGLSGSRNARTRAMVALQAESLAATLLALPAFWAAAPQDFTLSAGDVSLTGGTVPLEPGPDCAAVACDGADLALFDLRRWAAGMQAHFPGYGAQVACDRSTPRQCTVQVQWTEHALVRRSAISAAAAEPAASHAFVLHVVP